MQIKDFRKVAKDHQNQVKAKNAGFRQWEHCYKYFDPKNEEFNYDVACLHLTSYLACWGMYRSSAFIKSADAFFHRKVIEEIRKNEYRGLRGLSACANSSDQELAHGLIQKLSTIYRGEMEKQKDIRPNSNIQRNLDTLVTKVLLGTLACCPAYDRYACAGMRKTNLAASPKKISSFKGIFLWGSDERRQKEIKRVKDSIYNSEDRTGRNKDRDEYPDFKIVDSYFFLLGKELSK